ncbi:hypothetical protein [Actinoplanes sp. TFC3]|uniref:hypothetical protein n=1 Tax=Actinoplanes sp. TFC3 TaxID=1710355 RepID=UPI00082F966B|nr:hypothetical protein [Actinoplanes sp. TFC3]
MGGFFEAVLSFPTVILTPLLVVVIGYWLVVIAGGADPGDEFPLVGWGAIPLSILITVAWFATLAASQWLGAIPGFVILAAAVILAWIVARVAVSLLRRFLPTGAEPSRADFVGLTCIVRTGRVTRTFGQAEVHAPDGSSAIVQVRQAGDDKLRAGTVALLYDVDPDGEFFWIVPADIANR